MTIVKAAAVQLSPVLYSLMIDRTPGLNVRKEEHHVNN
jgi:hypothetical protein